ncbi:unnamed protein product [Enterobius vermicularis]|uniref:Uncharacterized protein n=1 Tax=Enterobius vermicularis TaxID=51028 RepID=A0A0N4V4H6_ENTVE|nr:unnamed protein product [Enterobius vermicularis]
MVIYLFLALTIFSTVYSRSCLTQHRSPCAVRTRSFPLAVFTGDSTESSGMEPPVYDEFITVASPFNFSAPPKEGFRSFCDCPLNDTCSFVNDSYVIDIDRTISLAFCDQIKNLFTKQCHNAREFIRIIGNIHESGEALVSVEDVFMYCHCDRGYRRLQVEPWTDGWYAFVFQCA